MEDSLHIPTTINHLHEHTNHPYNLGRACGELLYHIAPLTSTHLSNAIDFRNKAPTASVSLTEFTFAIDTCITHLRTVQTSTHQQEQQQQQQQHNTSTGKKPRLSRKQLTRYTQLLEALCKRAIHESLKDVFANWNVQQTRAFNKGVDKGLTGIQWMEYPDANVVMEVGEGDWAGWLRGECEELGMREARRGRAVLERL